MPAYYSNTIKSFLLEPNKSILGKLASAYSHTGFYQMLSSLSISWEQEIDILKRNFKELNDLNFDNFGLLLEYEIPRRSKRIDSVIISHNAIIIIEFKIGQNKYTSGDKKQLLDYCNDLVDFHLLSRNKVIFPVLLSTETEEITIANFNKNLQIQELTLINKYTLSEALEKISKYEIEFHGMHYDEWNNSKHLPTPNIIQAAQELFAGHNVFEILHNEAGTKNLLSTCNVVEKIINQTKLNNEKSICFITGVPGAGKTLIGLKIIHSKELYREEDKYATYLSGNMPLVRVLSKALKSNTLIQNVHVFLKDLFSDKSRITDEEVIVFDEAQRAWNAEQSNKKFKRPYSEAEMMLEIMSRKEEAATIIALIGNGQEINTGEAGLTEWGKALKDKYTEWNIYISPLLLNKNDSSSYQYLFESIPENLNIFVEEKLHLKVPLRAIRTPKIADWVEKVLEAKPNDAKKLYEEIIIKYPLYLTRSLEKAKEWLKNESVTEKFGDTKIPRQRRYGIIASSGARRLRAFGLDVKSRLSEAEWFLNGKNDVRSSYFLEQPATEFSIQGLEIDWACVCWGEDLRIENEKWSYYNFWGTIWRDTDDENDKKYTLNTYRVLLTRAREGMIIWVPKGSNEDATRLNEYYEGTAKYLKNCGVIEI